METFARPNCYYTTAGAGASKNTAERTVCMSACLPVCLKRGTAKTVCANEAADGLDTSAFYLQAG